MNWESLENPIIKKTWQNGILVAIVLLLLYDNVVIVKLCEVIAFGLCIVYALQYLDGSRRRNCIFYALAIGFIVLVLPFNPVFLGINLAFPWYDPGMFSWSFLGLLLVAYGIMALMGIGTTAITVILQRRKLMHRIAAFKRAQVTEKDAVVSIFHYFLKDPTISKTLTLILFITAASLVEEVLYRFVLFNVLAVLGLNVVVIIVISMIVFGWAHVENGNYAYIINSTMCGLVFSLVFISPGDGGLISVWICHLMWNTIVVIEHKIELVSQGY